MRSRLTKKLTKVQKNVRAPYYMATLEEKQIDNAFENGMTKYVSQRILMMLLYIDKAA